MITAVICIDFINRFQRNRFGRMYTCQCCPTNYRQFTHRSLLIIWVKNELLSIIFRLLVLTFSIILQKYWDT